MHSFPVPASHCLSSHVESRRRQEAQFQCDCRFWGDLLRKRGIQILLLFPLGLSGTAEAIHGRWRLRFHELLAQVPSSHGRVREASPVWQHKAFLSFGDQPRKRGCMFLGLEVPEWARHRRETQLPRVSMPFLGRPIFQEGLRPAMEEGGTTFTPLHLRAYLALPWSSMKEGGTASPA